MTTTTELQGRHIVIVGGSRGIGAAAAKHCAAAGGKVSIIYRANADAAHQTALACGPDAAVFQADASNEGEITNAVEEAVARHGAIHGLVVSAGIFEGIPLHEMTVEFWERTMSQNLRSTFLSVREATRFMDDGSIVIYTSTAGQRGSAVYSAYATSKGAQIMFMRSMALELGPEIRVNCIAPAWTETDMADASLTALGRENVAPKFVLGRIGQPSDVASATVFLLSDRASFITGVTLTVDGGMDMRG